MTSRILVLTGILCVLLNLPVSGTPDMYGDYNDRPSSGGEKVFATKSDMMLNTIQNLIEAKDYERAEQLAEEVTTTSPDMSPGYRTERPRAPCCWPISTRAAKAPCRVTSPTWQERSCSGPTTASTGRSSGTPMAPGPARPCSWTSVPATALPTPATSSPWAASASSLRTTARTAASSGGPSLGRGACGAGAGAC